MSDLISDSQPHFSDIVAIAQLVRETGVFTETEIATAAELVETTLQKPLEYRFIFLRDATGEPVAYSCFGEIPLTDGRYDLYWIVVSPRLQGKGLAVRLLQETLAQILTLQGEILYAETSGTKAYATARRFYEKMGFAEAARLPDFYREGDDKVVFAKRVASG